MNPFRHLLDELNEVLDRRPSDGDAEDATGDDDALHQLRADVEDKLAHDRPADEDPERHSYLVNSLQEAEDRFQANHPRLAQAIQTALRSLADAGF
ncbi:MAG TPA: DUF4404 family protein [Sporichthya sp.]|nr:DUF4404 family protein [Sporichthya sp.]